jgi:ABC-type sugar transport system ATPase subunit
MKGKSVVIDVDPAASKLKPSRVTIGIRPRAFAPVDLVAADTIEANAELIEPMGAETLIHAKGTAGHEIRAVVPREVKVRVGETLHLRADPRQTHIFDENGIAVRS